LLRRKKEIAVGANGEMLAALLLEPAVDTALTREGIKIVNVELALGEGTPEVSSWIVSQPSPIVKAELMKCQVSWTRYTFLSARAVSPSAGPQTYHLERVHSSTNLHLPDVAVFGI
jgi:hypothetical protein